jgi:hypothetical protein
MEQPLVRVTLDLQPNGTWLLIRQRADSGDRFVCDDLHDAFDAVLAAYRPDGTPRGLAMPSGSTGKEET